jgi:hypothetical protein
MASPVTIQPSLKDTRLYQYSPTTNFGTQADLYTWARTDFKSRVLESFDFSASVPTGATITTATLSLRFDYPTPGHTLTVYRLLHTDWAETEATWNVYKTGSAWGTAGATNASTDYTATDAATAASRSSAGWLGWDVKNQAQTALDSVSGVAHFLLEDSGADEDGSNTFRSKENSYEPYRPKLYIEFTTPSALQTVNGLAKASVQGRNGLAIASIKTWNGLS